MSVFELHTNDATGRYLADEIIGHPPAFNTETPTHWIHWQSEFCTTLEPFLREFQPFSFNAPALCVASNASNFLSVHALGFVSTCISTSHVDPWASSLWSCKLGVQEFFQLLLRNIFDGANTLEPVYIVSFDTWRSWHRFGKGCASDLRWSSLWAQFNQVLCHPQADTSDQNVLYTICTFCIGLQASVSTSHFSPYTSQTQTVQ